MPEICRFYGIVIQMFYSEHNPPHFHATYSGHRVEISIKDVKVINGSMSRRGLNLVLDWAEMHQEELMREWELARAEKSLFPIKPIE